MLISFGAIVIGLATLAWGGDRFIVGASATARGLGVSPVLVGLTIVGFATSAPEMLVSAVAAWSGTPELAIGNAVGSNIANIGLVLGIAVLVRPLVTQSQTLRRELPALLISTFLPFLLLLDGTLSRVDAAVMLGCLVVLVYWLAVLAYRSSVLDPIRTEYAAEIRDDLPMSRAAILLVIGLAALLGGAQLLVWGATDVARALGVSELVIGLTVVAVGTSLPELAVAIAAARKNEPDLVLGNVIGSNIFNMLAVIGISGVIAPHRMPADLLSFHYPVMIVMTLGLFILTYNRGQQQGSLGRRGGAVILGSFVVYHAVLAHEALGG
jgi:cation:H+ antiporter